MSHSLRHDSAIPPCSGLNAYRELTEAGLDVRIFERDSVPGGNWHYTEEAPLDALVPNAPTPISDFVPSLPPAGIELPYSEVFENDGKIYRDHRGPKPIWEALTSNAASVCWFVLCGRKANNVLAYIAYTTGGWTTSGHFSSSRI